MQGIAFLFVSVFFAKLFCEEVGEELLVAEADLLAMAYLSLFVILSLLTLFLLLASVIDWLGRRGTTIAQTIELVLLELAVPMAFVEVYSFVRALGPDNPWFHISLKVGMGLVFFLAFIIITYLLIAILLGVWPRIWTRLRPACSCFMTGLAMVRNVTAHRAKRIAAVLIAGVVWVRSRFTK